MHETLCARLRALTSGRRFRPSPWGALLALALAAGCVQLGDWQRAKAERKLAAQHLLDTRGAEAPLRLDAPAAASAAAMSAESLHARPLVLRGRFEPEHQFLLDNRVHREVAGYHVITPFLIDGSALRVLVNRGWIPAPARHSEVPQVATPGGTLELHGRAIAPPTRFFTLGDEPASGAWPQVWQNLELARFARLVPGPLASVVVQLDADAPAGFTREWPRPDERFERHLSYAYQWYGFAAAAVLIWLALGWRRT